MNDSFGTLILNTGCGEREIITIAIILIPFKILMCLTFTIIGTIQIILLLDSLRIKHYQDGGLFKPMEDGDCKV
jgi:hypothetical protein